MKKKAPFYDPVLSPLLVILGIVALIASIIAMALGDFSLEVLVFVCFSAIILTGFSPNIRALIAHARNILKQYGISLLFKNAHKNTYIHWHTRTSLFFFLIAASDLTISNRIRGFSRYKEHGGEALCIFLGVLFLIIALTALFTPPPKANSLSPEQPLSPATEKKTEVQQRQEVLQQTPPPFLQTTRSKTAF